MPRVPILYGSRLLVAETGEDGIAIAPPPPPREAITDVGAAVRDALRFPLAGEPLEAVVPRGGRVTILIEPPGLPIPGSARDPRQAAIAAASEELERIGVPTERQTLLVASGLARRPGRRVIESLVARDFALRFRGEVAVHDAEDPGLLDAGDGTLVNRALVETDAIVTVGAAQTLLHGGPASLLAAASAEAARRATADSLLETRGAPGWEQAVALERTLGRRVPVVGASLRLDAPRISGRFRGYPYEPEAVSRVAGSVGRRALRFIPAAIRSQMLASLALELTTSAVFAGPPSVAHVEALVRAVDTESAVLEEPLDAIVVGVPRTTPFLPRERPNALVSAALGLGYALRLWRDGFPVRDGGTAILVSPFRRRFTHPTQQPYRSFFHAARAGREALPDAERAATADARAIEQYRSGRTCHPLLPFADWESCRPALGRLGAVLVAGCRDSTAARQLGFVPTHGLSAALEMARGLAGGQPRIGFLLSPPYFPLRRG